MNCNAQNDVLIEELDLSLRRKERHDFCYGVASNLSKCNEMQKIVKILFGILLIAGFCSCGEPSQGDDFDEALLYGTWKEGSVYERYFATSVDFVMVNGETVKVNGKTWDVSDDISEDEAQAFNWTLSGTMLTHEHVSTFVNVPKIYTITSLTSSKLSYCDDYGNTHHFSKIFE